MLWWPHGQLRERSRLNIYDDFNGEEDIIQAMDRGTNVKALVKHIYGYSIILWKIMLNTFLWKKFIDPKEQTKCLVRRIWKTGFVNIIINYSSLSVRYVKASGNLDDHDGLLNWKVKEFKKTENSKTIYPMFQTNLIPTCFLP